MVDQLLQEANERMVKALDATKKRFASIRAGRASVAMLDGVKVEQYGSLMPLNQVANVSAPEARLLTIDPWDKSVIKDIEKAISNSGLGLTPNNDGKLIRLQIPELTSERRKEYVKIAKKDAEEGKIAIRNVRKDINNKLRKAEKDGDISQDELKAAEDNVQKVTDKFIKDVDTTYAAKEKEITTV